MCTDSVHCTLLFWGPFVLQRLLGSQGNMGQMPPSSSGATLTLSKHVLLASVLTLHHYCCTYVRCRGCMQTFAPAWTTWHPWQLCCRRRQDCLQSCRAVRKATPSKHLKYWLNASSAL